MEPERPIEKLVSGYAERRRKNAEPAQILHPVQRQALLAEVRRQFRSRPTGWGIPAWWPRLAWALGCLLVLGLAAAVWLPSAMVEKDVANKNQGLQASKSTLKLKRPGELPLPTTTSTLSEGNTQFAAAEMVNTNTVVALTDRFEPVSTGTLVAATPAAAVDLAVAKDEALPAPSARELTPSASSQSNLEVAVQNFSQVPAQLRAESATVTLARPASAQPVLAAFRLEQNGSQLRVVDNDGSVYSGSVEPATAPVPAPVETEQRRRYGLSAPANSASSSKAVARDEAAPATPTDSEEQQYQFRVVGTNRSVNQKVVFTGNLIENTVSNMNVSTQLRQQVPRQMLLNNTRITGRAQVGAKEIQVNAVPAP